MFLFSKWMELPINTRHTIAGQFSIPKKGSTHVIDNVIQSDGYAVKDIEQALNVIAIQKYLSSDITDMAVLWELFIFKITNPGKELPNVEVKKKGRPKKNVK